MAQNVNTLLYLMIFLGCLGGSSADFTWDQLWGQVSWAGRSRRRRLGVRQLVLAPWFSCTWSLILSGLEVSLSGSMEAACQERKN